jgi:hypothetical protein
VEREGARVRNSRGAGKSTLWIACIIVGILIFVSPLLLLLASRAGDFDWVLLGNVGQAYGLASALASSIALVAVARTLSFQTKQNKISHLQAFRAMQADVARFSFDYPDDCLGAVGATTAEEMSAARANIFRTFYARFFCDGLEMGEFTEWDVRHEFAAGILSTEGGRNWWRWARPGWVDSATGASEARLRFGRILDDAFLARSPDDASPEALDTNYERLAARTLSRGDIFSGKSWVPPIKVQGPRAGAEEAKSDSAPASDREVE